MNLKVSPSFSYNQKEVLSENIIRCIRDNQAESLLDIGAGDGVLASKIANTVSNYLAVERNESSVKKLRSLKLEAKEGVFPNVTIEKCFDIVLTSHSIPEGKTALYKPFLTKAWDLVCPKGILLIITFKGADHYIQKYAEKISGKKYDIDPRYMEMMQILETFGDVKIEKVKSFVTTSEMSDLKEVFGEWFWRDKKEREQFEADFEKTMDQHFKEDDLYKIPTEHLLISVKK